MELKRQFNNSEKKKQPTGLSDVLKPQPERQVHYACELIRMES